MDIHKLLEIFPECDIDMFGNTISVTYGISGEHKSVFVDTDNKYILSYILMNSKSASIVRNDDSTVTMLLCLNDDFDIDNAEKRELIPENDLVCAIETCLKCVDAFAGLKYDVIYKTEDFCGCVELHMPKENGVVAELKGFDLACLSAIIDICSDVDFDFYLDSNVLNIVFYG